MIQFLSNVISMVTRHGATDPFEGIFLKVNADRFDV